MTPMPDVWTKYGPHKDLLSSAVLADVLDALGHRSSALPPAAEPARPYAVELECIDALRPGDVLVATMNGDRGSALWGELLSTAARAHGATGAVIDGLTRDAARIVQMDFPV